MRYTVASLLLSIAIQGWAAPPTFYGPTSEQDHLWQIAQMLRPEKGVSVQQMMVALVRANPQAFLADNVNGLRSGFLLQVPELSQIQSIATPQATLLVAEQNNQWKALMQSGAEPMATTTSNLDASRSQPVSTSALDSSGNALDDVAFRDKTATDIQALSQQVSDLVQANEQKTAALTAAMKKIQEEHNLIQMQIANMDQRIGVLATDVQSATQVSVVAPDALLQATTRTPLQTDPFFTQNTLKTAFSGLILLLLLAVWFFWPKSARRATSSEAGYPSSSSLEADGLGDEYDFMGSLEGIPAQLDLARVYIDMEDRESAKEVLRQVFQRGNEAQKQQAADLLKQYCSV